MEEAAEAVLDAAVGAVFVGKAKLTISVKRRLSNGDEVFIAPGIELDGLAEDLDATKATVTDHVNGWLDDLLAAYPDSDPIDDEEEEEADDEEEEDDDADADDEDEDDDDEEGEDLTEDEIKKMKKAELETLAEECEIELESTKVADMRKELIEALFEEDDEDDEEEADDADDEDDEDGEEGYTEDELKATDLKDLQEIVDGWGLDHPSVKKGAKLAVKKKAYIKTILEAQEEE